MITKELINEINELSRKQRSVGLTPEEKERQAELRQVYLLGFRENMKNVLDRIEIVDKADWDQLIFCANRARICFNINTIEIVFINKNDLLYKLWKNKFYL